MPDLYMVFLKIMGALSLSLFFLYLFFRFFKNFYYKEIPLVSNRIVNVIENYYLGNKKRITVFKVPGGVLIVGISSERMDLLAHIKEEDCAFISEQTDDKMRNSSFAGTLLNLLPIKKTGENHDNSQ